MPRSLGLLALLLLVAPPAHAAPPAPYHVAVAPLADVGAVVAWIPGGAPADAYAIYGVGETGAATLLATVSGEATWTVVTGSFAAFGVAAIVDGVESTRQDGSGCAGAALAPPNVFVSNQCVPPLGAPVPVPGKLYYKFEIRL